MRAALSLVLVAVVVLAGCGGGDGGEKSSSGKPAGDQAAKSFIACFSAPGYKAVAPASGQESLFALEADRRGFPNTPVNVNQGKEITAAVFLVFFHSAGKAKQALDEIGRTTVGDIPPQQRGAAVVAYAFKDDKARTEAAVNKCL